MVQATARKYGVTHRRSKPLRLSLHPDTPAESDWGERSARVRGSTKLAAVDLICGAGGFCGGCFC